MLRAACPLMLRLYAMLGGVTDYKDVQPECP
jgi:hypothetical protein